MTKECLSIDKLKYLLLLITFITPLNIALQILSLLSWNNASETFITIIHSLGIHICYIVIDTLILFISIVIYKSLQDKNDIYVFNEQIVTDY